jgi:adenylate cyclase
MTDYLALMVKLEARSHEDRSHGNVIVTSWTTTRTYGFADADIAALLRVRQRLGVAAKLAIKNEIAENVVSTYLGPRAGSEVLQGHIQRGDGRTIHAIVWHSDLRGSSALADKMSSSRYIALLNGYFECAAGAVIEAGGEVLNFICDVVLAIFPVVGDTIGVSAAAAMDSALEVRRRLKDVNENLVARGVDLLDFGVGLHVGDVVFGNIGAGSRLAFTTIGSAVNEVARLEEMTKTLDTPILTSGEFKAILDESRAARLHSHGFRKLRGIGAPLDIYSLGS